MSFTLVTRRLPKRSRAQSATAAAAAARPAPVGYKPPGRAILHLKSNPDA